MSSYLNDPMVVSNNYEVSSSLAHTPADQLGMGVGGANFALGANTMRNEPSLQDKLAKLKKVKPH